MKTAEPQYSCVLYSTNKRCYQDKQLNIDNES